MMNSENNKSMEPMQDFSSMPLRPTAKRAMDIHGGRIVRAAGRKDRHSKVCTARGPRDRRVRLSPNTAIQFYDVQDRLGYDRPSKAIDWLMKEAKAAIDALDDDDNGGGAAARAFERGQVQSQEYLNGIPFGNCGSFSVENGQFLAYPNAANGQEQSMMMIPDSFQRLLAWNSNSSSNLGDSDQLPVHYPSIPLSSHYDEDQLHHLQREPLQSSSAFFSDIREPLHSQFSDHHHHHHHRGEELSGEIQDMDDQVPASFTSLLHYHQN